MIELSATTFSIIIGSIVILIFFTPFIAKEILQMKCRGKILGIFVAPTHKARFFLCKQLDPGSISPRIEAPKGYGDYMVREECYLDIQYPVGLPSFLQVSTKGYVYSNQEGSPIQFYGKEPKYNPLALQAIRNEKVTANVMAKADDFSEMMKGFIAQAKQLIGGKMITYVLIGIGALAAGFGAYYAYQMYTALKMAGYI